MQISCSTLFRAEWERGSTQRSCMISFRIMSSAVMSPTPGVYLSPANQRMLIFHINKKEEEWNKSPARKDDPSDIISLLDDIFIPETYIMYFIWRCWFLNCSVQRPACTDGGGGDRVIKFLYAPAPPPPAVGALKPPSWDLVHKTTYATMIYKICEEKISS